MKALKYNTIIIGAGSIGANYDNPESQDFLTHAHAFSAHPGFYLAGFVDGNHKQAGKAVKKWGTKAFGSIEEALAQVKVDVISIATPTETHYPLMLRAIKSSARAILLEKPIASSIDEANKLLKLCQNSKKAVTINYFRRFLPEIEKVGADIRQGKYGKFLSGSGYYGKGLINNGSHMIDLLHFLIGNVSSFKTFERFNDYSAADPTITAVLSFSNDASFIMKGVNSKAFTLFELDLIFEKRRIRITESGQKIEFFKMQKSRLFKGYQNMIKLSEQPTSFSRYMLHVVDNIYKNLNGKDNIKCDFFDGYKTFDLCSKITKTNHK